MRRWACPGGLLPYCASFPHFCAIPFIALSPAIATAGSESMKSAGWRRRNTGTGFFEHGGPVKRLAAFHWMRRREGRDAFPHGDGGRVRGRVLLPRGLERVGHA